MSRIAGIFNLDGQPVEKNQVLRMAATLEKRGPDGTNVWINEMVGLGHNMLWTTPESKHESIPLAFASGDLVITADARFDNRRTFPLATRRSIKATSCLPPTAISSLQVAGSLTRFLFMFTYQIRPALSPICRTVLQPYSA